MFLHSCSVPGRARHRGDLTCSWLSVPAKSPYARLVISRYTQATALLVMHAQTGFHLACVARESRWAHPSHGAFFLCPCPRACAGPSDGQMRGQADGQPDGQTDLAHRLRRRHRTQACTLVPPGAACSLPHTHNLSHTHSRSDLLTHTHTLSLSHTHSRERASGLTWNRAWTGLDRAGTRTLDNQCQPDQPFTHFSSAPRPPNCGFEAGGFIPVKGALLVWRTPSCAGYPSSQAAAAAARGAAPA